MQLNVTNFSHVLYALSSVFSTVGPGDLWNCFGTEEFRNVRSNILTSDYHIPEYYLWVFRYK